MSVRYKQFTGWFLAALILFGQSVALAHESGHDIKFTDEYCVQCLTQSVFDNKAVVPVIVFTVLSSAGNVRVLDEGSYHSPYSRTNPARAPPVSPA